MPDGFSVVQTADSGLNCLIAEKIEVFSINRAWEEQQQKNHIDKEFRRAAKMLSHWLIPIGKKSHPEAERKRRQRSLLTEAIRNCSFSALTRINPKFPESLRAKNLIFLIHASEDASWEDLPPTGFFINSPREKIVLPYDSRTGEYFIPMFAGGRVCVNMKERTISAQGISTKQFRQELTGNYHNPRQYRDAELEAEGHQTMHEIAACRGIKPRRTNRDQIRAGRKHRMSRGQRPHLAATR